MKYRYDCETDILLITLGKKKLSFGEHHENIITHFSQDRRLAEIEILDAKRTVQKIAKLIASKKKE